MKRLFYLFSSLGVIVSAASAQIAAGTVRTKIADIDVIAYKSGVRDVVYLRGTLPAGDAKDPADNPVIARLVGGMLDRGTTKHTKAEITAMLEGVGASIDFSAGDFAAEFNARCLARDVPLVVSLIAEQLRSPAFTAEEFGRLKQQMIGGLKRAQESTDFRSSDEYTRAVYTNGHPNRQASPDEKIAAVQAATLDQVKKFHATHYGPAYFTIVAAGDIDVAALQGELGRSFAGWTGGTPPSVAVKNKPVDTAKEQAVFMADKTSVSITLGQPTGLRYGDPDFFALRTATAILGSGFTGRLMGNVRDKEGLTYGIGSSMNRDTFTDGDWSI
ncbi:MAG TPA: pitrilysin family protein, partial [Lacunisphaera sp.]|nr:pitrilysin family protein [Lacunisphaera sp.]